MVCLGPRKKEKKSALLSPDDAANTTRSLKKSSTKLKGSKTNNSLSPSVVSKKTSPRTSIDATKKAPGTHLPRPTSRNTLVSNERTSATIRRSPSPNPPKATSRPTSMMSVKSTASVASTATPKTSKTPQKRYPITEMKEEVKDLKAKVT